MRSYPWCNFWSEEGNRTPPCHEVGDDERYGYWRWPVSSCIRHTHYQISTTVQIFLLDQNTREQLAKPRQLVFGVTRWRWRRATGWADVDVENLHACVSECVRPLSLHVVGVDSAYCYMNGGSLLWHGGSNERKEKQGREERTEQLSTPHGSTGCRHRFYCYLLRRQGRAR